MNHQQEDTEAFVDGVGSALDVFGAACPRPEDSSTTNLANIDANMLRQQWEAAFGDLRTALQNEIGRQFGEGAGSALATLAEQFAQQVGEQLAAIASTAVKDALRTKGGFDAQFVERIGLALRSRVVSGIREAVLRGLESREWR